LAINTSHPKNAFEIINPYSIVKEQVALTR